MMCRRKQIHCPPRRTRGAIALPKGARKASFLFAMEYKKGEINGQMVFSQWLLITFTHQGKCIARDRSGGPLLGSRARLQIPTTGKKRNRRVLHYTREC